jgi:hypothetical protein
MKLERVRKREYIPLTLTFQSQAEERVFMEFVDSYNNHEALYRSPALASLLVDISNWMSNEEKS